MITTRGEYQCRVPSVCLVLLSLTGGAHAIRMSDPYYHLTEDVVTPHIEWAKPYIKGPLKILAIAPRWTQRESVELSERLDADITPVMIYGWEKFGLDPANPGWAPMEGAYLPDVEAELNRGLEQKYDCIVMGAFAWKLLPRKCQYLILKQVSEGTGLVYFYPKVEAEDTLSKALAKKTVKDEAGFITSGIPFDTLSAFQSDPEAKDKPAASREDFLELHEFRNGRIALVRYPGRPDNLYCTPTQRTVGPEMFAEYEYYQSLAIRTILWAARKESGFMLKFVLPIEPIVSPSPVLSLTMENATGSKAHLDISATTRDLWHQDEGKCSVGSFTANPGSNAVSVPSLPMKAGKHYLDVIATSAGKVVAWGSMVFETDGPTHITDVTLGKDSYEKNENVTARVSMNGVSKPLTLVALLRDTYGRVWAQRTLAVKPTMTELTVAFPLTRALTIGHHFVARLIDGKNIVAEMSHEFYVQQRDQDDFYLLQWPGGCRDYVGRMYLREAAKYGTDFISNWGVDEQLGRAIALENFRSLPYMTRYAGEADDKTLVSSPCFTDPKFLEGERQKLAQTTEKLKKYSLAGYTLGDECFFLTKNVDACMSPTCNADFVSYLKEQYGNLDALNREWGTSLKDWTEATPITLEEAKKTGQFARWADHRLHMESTFAAVMRNADQAIRATDPTARVGFDGPFVTNSYAGYDWWKLAKEFTMLGLYWHQPEQTEQMRCFLQPGTTPTGYWYGGYYGWRREGHERYVPWHTMLHGFNTAWWFCLATPAAPYDEEDAFAPDLRPYPEFLWTVEECNAIKRGIGKLLLHADRQNDGIAILYSQASVHAATIYPTFGGVNAAQNGADWLLEDSGLQYNYVSYEELAKGVLQKSGYKVCVLPNCQAISTEEAEQLRKFVIAGGLLVADVGAGRMDGHCKQVKEGMLNDVLGVDFPSGEPKAFHGLLQPVSAHSPIAISNFIVDADSSAQVTKGQALAKVGEVPAVILSHTGKGAAVLLNFGFAPYSGTRATPASDPHVALVKEILKIVGVKPRVAFVAGTERLRNFEAVFFKDGSSQYLAVLPQEGGKPEGLETTITLDGKYHIYDMREAKDLGVSDTIKARILPARAKVYSLLPYAVESVKATTKLDTGTRIATVDVSVNTMGGAPGRHCFHVEVESPAGKAVPCYSQNVLGAKGRAAITIPFAFSDVPGKWRVKVLDVASGRMTSVTMAIPSGRAL